MIYFAREISGIWDKLIATMLLKVHYEWKLVLFSNRFGLVIVTWKFTVIKHIPPIKGILYVPTLPRITSLLSSG